MSPSTASEFESWSVPEIPLTIEYLPEVLEEIRLAASQGLRELSRGGIEKGGVLFGTRGANSIRITNWRPIPCEHARGPAFLLSQRDRTALELLLHGYKDDPDLAELHALGWVVSHTRSGLELTEADLSLYEHYFPWSWQTTLVLRPSKEGSAEAGFFARDANGNLKSDQSYRPFSIQANSRVQPARARGMRLENARERDEPAIGPALEPEPSVPPETEPLLNDEGWTGETADKPGRDWALKRWRAWIWAVPVVLAVLVLALMWQRKPVQPRTPSLGFRAADNGGALQLEWDKDSEAIRNASRGVIEIKDGDAPLQIALDSVRLSRGSFIYPRKSGDLEVRMTVYPPSGPPVQEFTRFVVPSTSSKKVAQAEPAAQTDPAAHPPAIVDDAAQLRRERDQLRAEVGQLRGSLQKATARNRELEQVVRILENRVQVQKLLSAGEKK